MRAMQDGATTAERLALLAALVDGDLGLAYELATSMLAAGTPFEAIAASVLAPVQHELGRRWVLGDLSIADEHAASATAEELITLLTGALAPPDGPHVVVACAEGDAHSLPARVVAGVLTLEGFRVTFLGSSLPAADLGQYLSHCAPVGLALSVSIPSALTGVARSVSAAHGAGVPVVLGGRSAGNAERAARLGADAYAPDIGSAVDVLRSWIVEPPTRLATAPPIGHLLRALASRRPALVAAALDVVGDLDPGALFLADEIARVMRVVEGGLLVDEPALAATHAAWLREAADSHGASPGLVDRLLDALIEATAGPFPAAADALTTGRG